jgi:hypothetical protein
MASRAKLPMQRRNRVDSHQMAIDTVRKDAGRATALWWLRRRACPSIVFGAISFGSRCIAISALSALSWAA